MFFFYCSIKIHVSLIKQLLLKDENDPAQSNGWIPTIPGRNFGIIVCLVKL